MQVVADGLLTDYFQEGKGKDVLLLHGWGDNRQTFDRLSKNLAQKFRVTALDLPGFGASQIPPDAWGLDDYAKFLNAFCKKLNIKPTVIIGHSNGGALAIRSLSSGSLKADKLVLLASAGVRNPKSARLKVIKVVARTGRVVTFWLPKDRRQKLRKMLYGSVGSDMLVVPHMQETFRKTVRQDIQTDATKLNIPVLLIYGDKDRATPALTIGKKLHQLIPGSKLEILPGVEHFVHLDAPEISAQLIMEFA